MMSIGYVRPSHQRSARLQVAALAGEVGEVVIEEESSDQPRLASLIEEAVAGETVIVVESLDRLSARSQKDLRSCLLQLHENDIGLRSLTEGIDTTAPGDPLALVAAVEKADNVIRGEILVKSAKPRVNYRVAKAAEIKLAQQMYDKGGSLDEIIEATGLSRATIYRNITPNRHPTRQS